MSDASDSVTGTGRAMKSGPRVNQDLWVVASPWGDGSWVALDNPDPHAGAFFADCSNLDHAPDSDLEHERAQVRAEAIVQLDRIVCTLRAAFVAGMTEDYVKALDESVGVYDNYLEELRSLEAEDV